MRILAIRGKNLASLAEPFSLDLAAEPLVSAGLFAITGETGAGKSTILDAMCLALYGTCPRLSNGSGSEKIPDAGDFLGSSDPRSCLRRGAADGFAEVDFVGVDDVPYQVTWTARRARNRAGGTLQAVTRTLRRLDTGDAVESGVRDVEKAVVARTGLTYDEFRRTVLLAQGDFDAFLRADTNARADLLEKVTGTEIYRSISRRVYENHTGAAQAVAVLETRREAQRLMPEEERAALAAEEQALAPALAADAERLVAVEEALRRHQVIAAARERVSQAEQEHAAREEAWAGLAPERDRLQALDAAEPLRPLFQRIADAEAALAASTGRAAAEATRLEAALAEEASAVAAYEAAEARSRDEEARFKAFGPVWDRAARLDAEVAGARTERDRAKAAVGLALEARRVALADLAACTERAAAAERAHAAAIALSEQVAGLRPLAERWAEIADRLAERASRGSDRRRAEADGSRLEDALAGLTLRGAALETEAERARQRRTVLDEDARTQRAALAALEANGWEDRAARLGDLADAVAEAGRAAAEARQASEGRGTAAATLAMAETELAAAAEALRQAEMDVAAGDAAANALTAPLARAEDAASDAAAHLRRRLVPGEPCPVCGASEHPVQADAAWAAHAAALRREVEEARAAAAAARGRADAATTARAVAQARSERERDRITNFATALDQAAARFVAARDSAAVHAETVVLSLAEWPQEAHEAGPAVAASAAAVIEERRLAAEALRHGAVLREALDRLQHDRDAAQLALENAALQRAESERESAAARQELALARQLATQAGERLAAIDRELEPAIAPAGIGGADLDRDPDGARRALERGAERFRDAVTAREAAGLAVRDEANRLAEASHAGRAAEAAHADASGALARREAEFAARSAERSPLLDGEATETHRSRVNGERLLAQEAKDAAVRRVGEAASLRAGIVAARDAAVAEREAASARLAAAVAGRDTALAQAGAELGTVTTLLAIPAAERQQLRETVSQAERGRAAVAATLADRRQALTETLVMGPPEGDPALLAAERQAIADRQGERHARLGAIASQLFHDDRLRAEAAGLDEALAAAKGVAHTWAAVNEAVGSQKGDRFARFAQGITLDLLVGLANHHLEALKPRYRLERTAEDLGLQVLDRDLGDEPRSTRSLSGGERFLVSLALALALSGLGGRQSFVDTLFIDEGFGSLDGESLDLAIDALESLRSQGRTVGVISHVEAMKDRIPVQVRVTREGAGRSAVSVVTPTGWAA